MTTLFPAGIDSFDIRSPQEIIRAAHMNDVQEAIVAIEVFLLGLDQSFDNHVAQAVGAHAASAISVVSSPTLIGGTYPITAANVQVALEQLKVAIDQVEQLNTDVSAFVAHLNADINTAHPGLILGSKIANNTITEDKLAFSIATQAELDAHEAEDINVAHSGQLLGTRIATGTLPESALDFDVATQAELNAHIASSTAHNASQIVVTPAINGFTDVQSVLTNMDGISDAHIAAIEGVHGILVGTSGTGYVGAYPVQTNAVVGRLDSQQLENKRIVSPFLGTKIVLFTDTVEDLEKEIFAPYIPQSTDSQIIVRKPSASRVNGASSGPQSATVIPVVNPARFTLGHSVLIRLATTYNPASDVAGTITAVGGSTVTVNFAGPVPGPIPTNSLLINTTTANPLFEVDEFGHTITQSLTVVNQQQLGNLVIDGDLTVQGNTVLGQGGTDTINIVGALTLTGSGLVTNNFAVSGLLSAGSFSTTGSIAGASLTISGASVLSSVNTSSNVTIGGNLTVTVGSGTFGGNVSALSFTATGGLYNGISLPLFKAAFDNHLPSGPYEPARTAGYQHHTDQLAYNSARKLINYNLFPADGYYPPLYMHFLAADKGIVTESFFATPFDPLDGYIQVDKVGIFNVGDHVLVGDPTVGYYGRTITALDVNTVPQRITLDTFAGVDTLDGYAARIVKRMTFEPTSFTTVAGVSYSRSANTMTVTSPSHGQSGTFLISITNSGGTTPSGFDRPSVVATTTSANTFTLLVENAGPTSGTLDYSLLRTSNVTDVLDAVAQRLYSHMDDGLPYPAHMADHVGTEPFNVSSPFFTPTPNEFGEQSVQAILDQFALRLYQHLDGYNPNGLGAQDGYYVHPAKDIGYDNSFSHISKRYTFTQDGYTGSNEVHVPPTAISGINVGDSVLISDDLPFAAEPFTIVDVFPNDGYVHLSGTLSRDYYMVNNPILSDFNIDSVQEAIEAISTGYDITTHLNDGYAAHNIKAISVDGSSGMPGFSAANGAEAFVELAGEDWNSAIHPDFYDHLFDLTAHEAQNIEYDGYSALLQATSPYTLASYGPVPYNDVQEALDQNYRSLHDHINNPLDAHDASAISITPISSSIPLFSPILATNVQQGLEDLQSNMDDGYNFHVAELDAHLIDPLDAHDASAISVVPFNNMVADNVQDALQEWNREGDLVETVFTIVNNQSSPADITGLFFNPAVVRSAHIEYSIYRYHLTPTVEVGCAGTLRLIYKPVAGTWQYDFTYAGDNVGVTFSVTALGQVQYTSTDLGSAPAESVIKFRAKVTGA